MVNTSNFTDFDEAIFKPMISIEWLTAFLLKIIN